MAASLEGGSAWKVRQPLLMLRPLDACHHDTGASRQVFVRVQPARFLYVDLYHLYMSMLISTRRRCCRRSQTGRASWLDTAPSHTLEGRAEPLGGVLSWRQQHHLLPCAP